MIQSKRRLLTARAFLLAVGKENPIVSILLAIVNISSLNLFIYNTYFSANEPLAFDLRAVSVKTKEHFYTNIPVYTNHSTLGLYWAAVSHTVDYWNDLPFFSPLPPFA